MIPRRNREPKTELNPAVNRTDAASQAIETCSARPARRRRVAAIVVLLICGGCFWFWMPGPAPQPAVTILPPDYSVPAPPLPIPDRWIPMNWRWLWRLRSAVLPANPTIDVETRLVRLTRSDGPLLAEILEGHASLTHNNGSVPGIFLKNNWTRLPGVSSKSATTASAPVG
jgi:hypothetical protein